MQEGRLQLLLKTEITRDSVLETQQIILPSQVDCEDGIAWQVIFHFENDELGGNKGFYTVTDDKENIPAGVKYKFKGKYENKLVVQLAHRWKWSLGSIWYL